MIVRMRWIHDGGNEWGNGRQTFERERRAALLAGYRIVPVEDLTTGERAQAGSLPVIETLSVSMYKHNGYAHAVPAGTRFTLEVEIEPDRGEE